MTARRPASSIALMVALALALAACGGGASGAPWDGAPAVPLDLRAAVSRTELPLLGEFELRLDLFARQDLEVAFEPAVPAGFVGEVRRSEARPLGDGRWTTATMTLRPVSGPGAVTIPPFEARAGDGTAASTPPIELQVGTLLEGASAELEAPAPPIPPARSLWPWFAVFGLCLLVVLLAFVASRRRQRRSPDAVEVPAHVRALRELARLRTAPRSAPAEVDAFYVAVSQVLRVYVEERFGLRAPERTTEEFLVELEHGGPLSNAQVVELRRFLHQCDLVKFAAQQPGEDVHLETLAIAEALVEQTRGDRASAATAPARAAAPEAVA